eukprot:6461164-Pyramimonas_sp.AAC.1
MASWASLYNPCPCCVAPKDSLFAVYPGFMDSTGLPFDDRTHESYEEAVRRCEVHVRVDDEERRAELLRCLAFRDETQKKAGGLLVTSTLPGLPLQIGGALRPSQDLPDIRNLWTRPLGFVATFWRARYDRKGRCLDWLSSRCPIFCEQLRTSPTSVLGLDTLHTVHLGVAQRLLSCVIWRAIEGDPWGARSLKQRFKRLETELFNYFEDNGVEHDRRI